MEITEIAYQILFLSGYDVNSIVTTPAFYYRPHPKDW